MLPKTAQHPHVCRMQDIAMFAGRPGQRRASATGQSFGDCFDEHVVQRGYALTLSHTSR
jgi:hypothetical protein